MATRPSRRRAANHEPSPTAANISEPADVSMAEHADQSAGLMNEHDHPESTMPEPMTLIEPVPPTSSTLHTATVLRETLLNGLQLTGRAAAPKSSIPILRGVRIEANSDEQTLRLACTNLEIGILQRVDAHVMQPWSLVIPVKTLTETVAAIPHEQVRLHYDPETSSVTIKGIGGDGIDSQCIIYGMDVNDFPTVNDGSEMEPMLTLHGETVRRMVRKLGFITSPVEYIPTHASVHLVMRDNTLICHTTDGFRLSQLSIPISEEHGTPLDLMLPKPTLRELGRIVEDTDQVVMRGSDHANLIWFTCNDTTLVSRIVDGIYPNVEKVLPKEYKTEARPRLPWLISLIRQAKIFAENNVVEVTFNPDHLAMRAVTRQTGATSVSMPCTVVGNPSVVHVNIEYLREACEAIELDDLSIEITGPTSPIVIREHNADRFVHAIMPMSPPKTS